MKGSILSLSACALLLTALPSCKEEGKSGSSGEPVTLKLMFQPGTKYGYDMDMKMSIEQQAMGQSMKMNNNMVMETTYEVASADGDNKTMKVSYDRMKMDVTSPMMNMKYDSRDTANNTPQLAAIGSLVGKQFTMTVNSKGEILKVEGMDKLIEGMPNSEMMQSTFSDSSIRNMMQQSMNIYPEGPVKVGDTWNRSYTTNMSGMNVTNNNTYKLVKVADGVADVEVDGKMDLAGGNSPAMQGMKMNIKGTQKGTMHIEIATGLIKNADLKQDIKGDIDANGMKIPMSVANTTTITGKKK